VHNLPEILNTVTQPLLVATAIWYFRIPLTQILTAIGKMLDRVDRIILGMKDNNISLLREPPVAVSGLTDVRANETTKLSYDPSDNDAAGKILGRDGRREVYARHRGVFLTHVIKPSLLPGHNFDVYIYLTGPNEKTEIDSVVSAKFSLGRYWNDKIFEGTRIGKFFGIETSAWAPFLCTCVVAFGDGSKLTLERWIDFESAWVFTPTMTNIWSEQTTHQPPLLSDYKK